MPSMPSTQFTHINRNSLAFYEWGQKGNPVLIWAGLFLLAQRNPTSGPGSSGFANCL